MSEPTKKHHWDPQQRRLLQESIDGKWTVLVDDPYAVEPECGLCARYDAVTVEEESRCDGCPVALFTGQPKCLKTPYWVWQEARDGREKLASVERDFLRKVLEAG